MDPDAAQPPEAGPAGAAPAPERTALVHDVAGALSAGDRDILALELDQGLDEAEVAAVLGTSIAVAHRRLARAHGHLERAVQVRLLWGAGATGCPRLDVALRVAGARRFGPRAARAITVHLTTCERCAHTGGAGSATAA